jgi:hypothetical protein
VTNINGKAYAMNAVTPMKTWKTPILLAVFFLIGVFKSAQKGLVDLSFIHFARWVVVQNNQFPRLAPEQPEEQLKYDYLLFFSNFNGTWNEYIDAFSAVLSSGLNLIWRWSEKFPGSVPVTAFKRYISLVQFDTDYYYTAYPYATTSDVKAAIRVDDALQEFANRAAGLTPEEFQQSYLQLLVKVQADIGALGPAPMGT